MSYALQFRHLANKVGNLERPFLKEFFPRWVELCGCPVLRYEMLRLHGAPCSCLDLFTNFKYLIYFHYS